MNWPVIVTLFQAQHGMESNSKAIKLEDTCCSLPSPSCKLKSISTESAQRERQKREERGWKRVKGEKWGWGRKNGPFVSPNGSFVVGGVIGVLQGVE